MKIITKSQAVNFKNSSSCSGVEFPFEAKQLNIAIAKIDGRYPATGHLVNEVCTEICYVLSGRGCVGVDEERHLLSQGNAILLNPGERYYWEGDGLEILMPCAPAFYMEQHKSVK